MGGSGSSGKSGFFSDTGGWLVNPLQKAFGDAGLAISNPVGYIMDKAGYGWADPVGAATTGYVRASRDGKAEFQDLTNPLLFGQTAEDRIAQAEQNKKAWEDYYKSIAEASRDRIIRLYGSEVVTSPTLQSSQPDENTTFPMVPGSYNGSSLSQRIAAIRNSNDDDNLTQSLLT